MVLPFFVKDSIEDKAEEKKRKIYFFREELVKYLDQFSHFLTSTVLVI